MQQTKRKLFDEFQDVFKSKLGSKDQINMPPVRLYMKEQKRIGSNTNTAKEIKNILDQQQICLSNNYWKQGLLKK